jgi:hypothetical protein
MYLSYYQMFSWYDLLHHPFNLFVCLTVLSATFNNISAISWRSVLLVEETGRPGENHRSVASHWQTLSHNVEHVLFYYYCFDCLRPVSCAHNVDCVSGFRILLTFTYKFYNVLLYVIYNTRNTVYIVRTRHRTKTIKAIIIKQYRKAKR